MMNEKFWMVVGIGAGVPNVRHPTRDAAAAEAERLARANHGKQFAVLEAAEVFMVRRVQPPLERRVLKTVTPLGKIYGSRETVPDEGWTHVIAVVDMEDAERYLRGPIGELVTGDFVISYWRRPMARGGYKVFRREGPDAGHDEPAF